MHWRLKNWQLVQSPHSRVSEQSASPAEHPAHVVTHWPLQVKDVDVHASKPASVPTSTCGSSSGPASATSAVAS
jgi:hypothetical protein